MGRSRLRARIHAAAPLIGCGLFGGTITAAWLNAPLILNTTLFACGAAALAVARLTEWRWSGPPPGALLGLVAMRNPKPGDGAPNVLVVVECRMDREDAAEILRDAADRLAAGTLPRPPRAGNETAREATSGGSLADGQA